MSINIIGYAHMKFLKWSKTGHSLQFIFNVDFRGYYPGICTDKCNKADYLVLPQKFSLHTTQPEVLRSMLSFLIQVIYQIAPSSTRLQILLTCENQSAHFSQLCGKVLTVNKGYLLFDAAS